MACRLLLAAAAALAPLCASAEPPVTVLSAPAAQSLGVGGFAQLSPPQAAASVGQLLLTEHPGYRTPLHVHRQTDESFYVLTGTLTLFVDGKVRNLAPGDYAFIPRGTPHAQGNTTGADAVSLVTLAPGKFAEFFQARAELVKTTPPEHPGYGPAMRALGQHHDIAILGPPPF